MSGGLGDQKTDQEAWPLSQAVRDELGGVWCRALEALGLRLRRGSDAFVSYDGRGTLWIAPDADLDPEDTLAQLIFHEVCHWAVEGEDAGQRVDWGFGPPSEDTTPERRCLELQAGAARHFGLARLMRPTTEFAPWYDQALSEARLSLDLLHSGRFAPTVVEALRATQHLVRRAR